MGSMSRNFWEERRKEADWRTRKNLDKVKNAAKTKKGLIRVISIVKGHPRRRQWKEEEGWLDKISAAQKRQGGDGGGDHRNRERHWESKRV